MRLFYKACGSYCSKVRCALATRSSAVGHGAIKNGGGRAFRGENTGLYFLFTNPDCAPL